MSISAVKLALLAKRLREESGDLAALRAEPVAIVGMGCRFPGGADHPRAFWDLLRAGTDAITEVPAERWNWRDYYDPDPAAPGKMTTRWGGFISQVDSFDAAFFGISPREALHLDPQQRLFLEVAYEALDDAGLRRDRLAGTQTGVFVASYHNDYGQAQYAAPATIDAYTSTGTAHSVLANRLSYLLDLRGPSVSVDTACSSSLVAVHLGCESLRAGESDVAVVGGVSLMLTPEMTVALSKWGFLTEDGRCKTFDARANGFVRGEGCGVIVLKRLSDALADDDTVLALIRGSAVNQDGRSNALTAPNGLAQQAVIRAALARAGATADEISYIEAHGTGTALGDPIEVEALAAVFAPRPRERRCVIGSVKTNIGHTEAAAGLAGLIKVVLAMRHELIPAHLHFTKPNPHLDFQTLPFEIPLSARAWARGSQPRLAGVSSFGFGGTNAHVVLEEAPALPEPEAGEAPAAHLLVISAQAPAALEELARRYRDLLATPGLAAGDVCYSAALTRDHLDYRLAVAGANAAELSGQLEAFLKHESLANGASGRCVPGRRMGIAFVFSGQGPQWWAMGQELRASEPVFATALEECDAALRPYVPWSLLQELGRDDSTSRLAETQIAQPALFAIQVALAALWRSWGVEPAAVIGHSVGEIAAAHVAGALTLDAAARLVALRAKIMQAATGRGRMAAVEMPAAAVRRIADSSDGSLSLAAVNGPQSCVLSGEAAALARELAALTRQGIGHRMLQVDYAFHSTQMEPFQQELIEALGALPTGDLRCAMISTVTGRELATGSDLTAAYWGRNLRQPVLFANAAATAMERGIEAFVELGPHPVLAVSIAAVADERKASVSIVASLRRGRPEGLTMRVAAAGLHATGATLNWSELFPAGGRRVGLPPYPWQRRRYWQATAVGAPSAPGSLIGKRIQSRAISGRLFEGCVSASSPAFLGDHRVGAACIVPATAQIEVVLSALGAALPEQQAALCDVVLRAPLVLETEASRTLQCALTPAGAEFTFEITSAPAGQATLAAGDWTVHSVGRAVVETMRPVAALDLASARARCDEVLDVSAAYASYAARGVQFGPAFQGVRHLYRGPAQALGRIVAPEGLRHGEFICHPAIFDACLQVVMAALPDSAAKDLYLPFAVDRITVYDRLPGELWSHATLRSGGSDSVFAADLLIGDASGRPVARIEGLRLARASLEQFQSAGRVAGLLYRTQWRPAEVVEGVLASGAWLVVHEDEQAAHVLRTLLLGRGAQVTLVPLEATESFAKILSAAPAGGYAGVVLLSGSGLRVGSGALQPSLEVRAGGAIRLVQDMLSSGDRTSPLWIVTRGARAVAAEREGAIAPDLSAAALWGLARSLAAEHPDFAVRLVDLDPRVPVLEPLLAELAASSSETEIAWRGGQRYIARLVHFAIPPDTPASVPKLVRLEAAASGLLEDMRLQALPPPPAPGPGEVEIEVSVSGLNFRDVLNALGMYPGAAGPLGGECAGRITRVGPGVHQFAPGDAVMAFVAGAFASRVIAKEAWVSRQPRGCSDAESGAIPIAFLTARYALERLAVLRRGQRVLIHAGAGGVGMAAIQLAHRVGAEVFATAGSEEKRALLRSLGVAHVFDSRSLDFAEGIRATTSGAGVHVVLNSLADEFIPASLDVLASGGRFLEMGKRGIWSVEAVAARRPDVSYFPFDLGDAARADPGLIPELFARLLEDFESGQLRAPLVASWPLTEAVAAFRAMAQARHIGKIVLTHGRRAACGVQNDGTYLITGGLGALGMATARWLADHGARHLILLGRGRPSPDALTTIESLRRDGVSVRTEAIDVTDAAALGRLFSELGSGPLPLRGIIHAAGILDDGVILQQTWARAARVLAPKALGGWVLAHHARALSLDFFVCYSSATGVLASGGQSTYSMANACLDALCHDLRSNGVAACSVQWGPWAEGGMAAALHSKDAARFSRQGVEPMSSQTALAALGAAIDSGAAEVAVLEVDWRRFAAAGSGSRRAFYEELVTAAAATTVPPESEAQAASFIQQYRAAPASQRRTLLAEQIRLLALRCLGLDAQTAVEEERPLKDLGLDSLMSVELRNALARALGCSLPATLAFDYPSVRALTGFLTERLEPPAARAVTVAATALAVQAVAGMSEDEAEAMLLAELGAPGPNAGGVS